MFKVIFFLLALLFVFQDTNASLEFHKVQKENSYPLCSLCIQLMEQGINILLNVIANGGIIGGCSELCGHLNEKLERTACTLLCDVVGIEGFIKALEAVDPDPFWMCMETKFCPVRDNAAASIQSLSVAPPQGPQGATFTANLAFAVLNETGTGEIRFNFKAPQQSFKMGASSPIISVAPGAYSASFKMSTKQSEQEFFPPGVYQIQAQICEGMCDSKHSNSFIMAQNTTAFTLTAGN